MTDILVNIGTGSQWITVPDEHEITESGAWSPEEDHLLRALYPHYYGTFVARALNRSFSSVSGRAAYLHIRVSDTVRAIPVPFPTR